MPSARTLTILVNTAVLGLYEDPADATPILITKAPLSGVPTAVSYGVLTILEHTSDVPEGDDLIRIWTGRGPADQIIQVALRGEGTSMTGTIVTG